MADLKIHSETAWDVASQFSHVLASDTRSLARLIDIALETEREACAKIAGAIDSNRGNEKEIAAAIRART